jgi:hypothetical protein
MGEGIIDDLTTCGSANADQGLINLAFVLKRAKRTDGVTECTNGATECANRAMEPAMQRLNLI